MTAEAGGAFGRLTPAMQYQVVNGLGWSGLRPVQALATEAILDGSNCVVLAPTAGGKTEAAFLPLLSRMDEEDWAPVSVLYLAPIRALLNNQEERLEKLSALVGRRAGKWHGDVKDAARKRMLGALPDVLAITPESLEAMLIGGRAAPRQLLSKVRAVVIDEVHAFAADDRGAHLVALLERVSRIAQGDIQRVGLSATVGDPEVIAEWLSGSSLRTRRVVDPKGARKPPNLALDYVGSLDNAATVVHRLQPGTRRLVFVDSRKRVEELGHRLSGLGANVYLSHSALALSERTAAEKAFAEGTDCVIVATSALELGIDVGDLDHVIQIDAPSTVSSFMQRMGRTGRRAGSTANCTFLATDSSALIQSAALLDLFEQGFIEPAAPSSWAPHVMAHQLLALAMQEQGVAAAEWWSWLDGCAAFREIAADDREEIVAHMLAEQILVKVDGRLVLGDKGERLYGKRNFLELYAVFSTPRVLSVLFGRQEVGVVDAFFLQQLDRRRANFVLGGRAWRVVSVDYAGGKCQVEPAESGSYPSWFGQPLLLSRTLCEALRNVLTGESLRPYWSKRAVAAIELEREAHGFLRDEVAPLVAEADGRFKWWTFGGGKGNKLLALLMQEMLGERVTASNVALTFADGAAQSEVAIRESISEVAARVPADDSALAGFADTTGATRLSKFQPCLPERIQSTWVARQTLSRSNATEAANRRRPPE